LHLWLDVAIIALRAAGHPRPVSRRAL